MAKRSTNLGGPKLRVQELITLLTEECGNLSEPEKKLAEAVVLGQECDLWQKGDERLTPETPAGAWLKWGSSRTIRATVIRAICVSNLSHKLVDTQGIRLFNAYISESLNLQGADVPFDVWLISCAIDTDINLIGAKVHTLSLENSRVAGAHADRLQAKGGVFLRSGFQAMGRISLSGARINGHLDCNGSTLHGDNHDALIAISIQVGGSVYLSAGFRATGQVRFHGSRVGGDLDCTSGYFSKPGDIALGADGIKVDGSVFLREGFQSVGEVRFVSAHIRSELDCSDAHFQNEDKDALCLQGTCIEGTLHLGTGTFSGEVDLTRSRIGYLVDDPINGIWPHAIILEDCRYDAIYSGAPMDSQRRLVWLANHDRTWLQYQPDGTPPDPGPYRWLASILRKQGHERDADKVLERIGWLRMQSLRTQRCEGNWRAKLKAWAYWSVSLLYGAIVGHGYARFRPLAWLLGFWLFGTAMFSFPPGPTMQPAQGLVLKEWSTSTASPPTMPLPPWQWSDADGFVAWLLGHPNQGWVGNYPKFHPAVYSLDAFLPLVDFHQEEYWTPIDGRILGWRWFVKNVYLPIHIASGWIIATLFAASFTRLARHD